MSWSLPRRRVIPGFGLTLGLSLTYLALIVLIPLAALVLKAAETDPASFLATLRDPRVIAAFRVSIGGIFARFGIDIAFTPLGILVALVFIGLPFVVRTVQPVLADLAHDAEEAALTLGATRWQIFFRVVLPALLPGVITGASLAFARGLGEYGSVIFIAGNMPGLSEIVPLLIVIKLEQFDYPGAAAIGVAMLVASFAILLAINLGQLVVRRRHGL